MIEPIKLYKKDHNGALRIWIIEADDDEIFIQYGVDGGELIEQNEFIEDGKAGRDVEEQIISRVNSRVNKKLDAGYSKSKEVALSTRQNLNAVGGVRPMLAKRIDKAGLWNVKGALVQYKYNGHRCMITNQGGELIAYSKNGKVTQSIDHILKGIIIPDGVTLDGELYHHGTSLQRIGSWVRKNQEESKQLIFMCYDIVMDCEYATRHCSLEILVMQNQLGACTELAPCTKLESAKEINGMFKEAKQLGYEGLIIRVAGSGYEDGKRTWQLLKVKQTDDQPYEDGEFLVIEILPSKDGWARLVCAMENGKTFKVSAPGDMAEKRRVLREKGDYIGSKVRVEYAELTEEGKPFHPIALEWREKETE